ncbi:integration host factor subunit alpha [Nocardioides gansuensis]|uniref:Integration host factor subunit alpha n=1 Tax=Nocardioides gansuensis TaxID=2138300 RepID=A0A2T8F849_9ACTN|nr:HU family DNA-binding protein [Nocardioides gansuensis]PVG81892.1 integration host factor subunit alpha [Nocardioides gansuensis]
MNRKELVETVAREAGLTAAQATAAVAAVLDGVVTSVARGEKVNLPGFGTFELRHRAARSGRNPQTGEAMEIAASDAPAFKPAAAFKQAVADR